MNNIVIIDDCGTDFAITGIAKLLVTLECYYKDTVDSDIVENENRRRYIIIIPIAQQSNKSVDQIKDIKDKFKNVFDKINENNTDVLDCHIMEVTVDADDFSFETLKNEADEVFTKIYGAFQEEQNNHYGILIDLCLTPNDQNNILQDNKVLSMYLVMNCYLQSCNSYLYTQYPPNQIVEKWNFNLLKLKKEFEKNLNTEINCNIGYKKIYYRGDINGEARFNKKLADKLIGK